MKKVTNIICIMIPFVVIIGILLFTLNSCFGTKKYTENYLEKYNDYLEYAFGEYEVIEKNSGQITGGVVPTDVEFEEYRIAYKNNSGQKYEFYFDNTPGVLENNLIAHARELSIPILEEKYINKYFPNQDFNQQRYLYIDVFNPTSEKSNDELMDKEDGIQFQQFDISSLDKYDLEISFSLNYNYEDNEYGNQEAVTELFLEMLSFVYEDTNNQNIKGYLTFYRGEDFANGDEYMITYDISTKQMVIGELQYTE